MESRLEPASVKLIQRIKLLIEKVRQVPGSLQDKEVGLFLDVSELLISNLKKEEIERGDLKIPAAKLEELDRLRAELGDKNADYAHQKMVYEQEKEILELQLDLLHDRILEEQGEVLIKWFQQELQLQLLQHEIWDEQEAIRKAESKDQSCFAGCFACFFPSHHEEIEVRQGKINTLRRKRKELGENDYNGNLPENLRSLLTVNIKAKAEKDNLNFNDMNVIREKLNLQLSEIREQLRSKIQNLIRNEPQKETGLLEQKITTLQAEINSLWHQFTHFIKAKTMLLSIRFYALLRRITNKSDFSHLKEDRNQLKSDLADFSCVDENNLRHSITHREYFARYNAMGKRDRKEVRESDDMSQAAQDNIFDEDVIGLERIKIKNAI